MRRVLLLGLCALPLFGSGIAAGPVTASIADSSWRASVQVSWKNAWNNAKNHDAAWVFLKFRTAPGGWRHARLLESGHSSASAVPAKFSVPADRAGAFVFPSEAYRGDVDWTLTLRVDPASLAGVPAAAIREWKAFAVEMVYVPEGAFFVGDPDPKAVSLSAYFQSDANGNPAGRYRVTSESAIEVGPREGALDYKVELPAYQGDRAGPVPSAFPKGFRAFYIMKYELTQGAYADFLNLIPEPAQNFRAIHAGVDYYKQRGSIRVVDSRFVAEAPARPANWVSWNDSIAFADWAGLRPLTEFEYSKASRGPDEPQANDFPWGTTRKDRLKRLIAAPVDDLVTTGDADEAKLTDANRDVFGASFYWVMDLAGSVWERVVTPANARGRAFQGSHGDGRITQYGSATNEDWPKGDEALGGFGYRGGGYYAHGFAAGEFNPHSPTEWRRFGAWGDGPRSVAYGFRAARTAE